MFKWVTLCRANLEQSQAHKRPSFAIISIWEQLTEGLTKDWMNIKLFVENTRFKDKNHQVNYVLLGYMLHY